MSVLEGRPTGLVTHFIRIGVALSVCPSRNDYRRERERCGVRKSDRNRVFASSHGRGHVDPVDTMLVIHRRYALPVDTKRSKGMQ